MFFNLKKSLFTYSNFYIFVHEQGIVTTLSKNNSNLYTPYGAFVAHESIRLINRQGSKKAILASNASGSATEPAL